MAKTTVGFGIALLVLGLGGYFATGMESLTALIPAAFGAVLVALGWLARNPRLRMHAMHGAALAGVLGFAGSVGGIAPFVRLLAGETVARPSAAVARSLMAVLCLAFVVLTVRSFVVARLLRKNVPPTAG